MPPKLRKSNTSGFAGVSWVEKTKKWKAEIRVGGTYRYLGLFDTAREAHAAYVRAGAKIPQANRHKPSPDQIRRKLLTTVRSLFDAHGIQALSARCLMNQDGSLYQRLIKAGLNQPALLSALGLNGQYREWKSSARRYRGNIKPQWSWDAAVDAARKIVERDGELPSVADSRKAGLSSLTSAVHRAGRTWDELRIALGLPPSPRSHVSLNGTMWSSRAQAAMSDFLHLRGVVHKKGERFPIARVKKTRRRWGRFDIHFRAKGGKWIDVKIGNGMRPAGRPGSYAQNPDFLHISYRDCLSPDTLEQALEPFIGILMPQRVRKGKQPRARKKAGKSKRRKTTRR